MMSETMGSNENFYDSIYELMVSLSAEFADYASVGFGFWAGSKNLHRATQAKRHATSKGLWGLQYLVLSGGILVMNVVSAVIKVGLLGLTGVVLAGLLTLLSLVYVLSRFVESSLLTVKAINKCYDANYVFKDRLIKHDKVSALLAKTRQQYGQLDKLKHPKKAQHLTAQIKQLKLTRTRLKKQAIALYTVKHEGITDKKAQQRFIRHPIAKNVGINQWGEQRESTSNDKRISAYLHKKMQQKLYDRLYNNVRWGAAGIGVALGVAAIAFPPLLVPAIVFSAIATVMTGASFINHYVVEPWKRRNVARWSKNEFVSKQDRLLLQEVVDELNTWRKQCYADKRIRLSSRVITLIILGAVQAGCTNVLAKQQYYRQLLSQPIEYVKAQLKHIEKNALSNTLIAQRLGVSTPENINKFVSSRDSKRLLTNDANHRYGFFRSLLPWQAKAKRDAYVGDASIRFSARC